MPASLRLLKAELMRWWPQITFALLLAFAIGAFRADASSTDANHERRLNRLEVAAPDITRDLADLKARAEETSRTVGRIEDKLDRLMEKDR